KHVPEATFARQLDILARWFKVISLSDAVAALAARRALPWNACVITFDDGYANNAETAAPLLLARGLPATFFITTELVAGHMALWVDRFELAYAKLHGTDAAGDAAARQRLKTIPTAERERELTELEARAGTAGARAPLHRAMSWDQARRLAQDGF